MQQIELYTAPRCSIADVYRYLIQRQRERRAKATAEAAQGSEAQAASAEEHLPEGKSNAIVPPGGNDEA